MASPRRSFFRLDPFLLLFAAAVFRIVDCLAHGGRLADVGFPVLYFIAMYLILRCLLSLPGSAAHWWTRFSVYSSIMQDLTWTAIGAPDPTPVVAMGRGMAAFGVFFFLHVFVNY